VRVIAGKAKGRPLKAVPGQNTRPTTDKVKEAIFSMIGPYFDGGNGLDLFAGSGGLGLEAWSRGMDRIVFIDKDKQSVDTLHANIDFVKAANDVEVYRNDAKRAIKVLAKRNMQFDLVFLDPPYKMIDMHEWMVDFHEQQMLTKDAVIVIEHDAKVIYPDEISNFIQVKHSNYGDIAVSVYHYNMN